MNKSLIIRLSFGMLTAPVALGMIACGSDATQTPGLGGGGYYAVGGETGVCTPGREFECASGGAPANGGTGPDFGSGGTAQGSGGTAGSAGGNTSNGGDQSFPGSTIEICPGANIINIPVSSFKECESNGCNTAHCVPKNALPKEVDVTLLGECQDTTTVCVPDDYTAAYGKFLAKSCASIGGAEGRCISTCVPQVNGLMDALPKADCGENERCAPCVNPNDGKETGACKQGCDPGQSQDTTSKPYVFETCQNGEGRCTPKSIIPEVLLSELVQGTCPSADQVCAPLKKAQNLKYNFPACAPSNGFIAIGGVLFAGGTTDNPSGQHGGCVPAWLGTTNPLEGIFLLQDSCKTGELCAPCKNPLKFGAATGACPVPLPSDPSGGLPPDGGSPIAGPGGATGSGGAGGMTSSGGAAGMGGAP